jgi:hypothetical protein
LYALDVGDNVFVAVGALGVIRTSQTGLSWEPVDSGTFWNLRDVTVLNAEYTAVGDNDVIVVGSLVSTLLDVTVNENVATAEDANSQGILNSSASDGLTFDEAVPRATYAPMPVLVAVTEHFSLEEDGATDVGGVVVDDFTENSTDFDITVTEQLALDDVDAWRYQGDMAELFFIFLDDAMALSSVQSTDQMVANSDAVDSFGVNDALAALSAFSHLVTDSFAMDDVPSSVGTMLITVGETVVLDDTLSISQTINGLINEGITFSVALTLDGETYLAWVMNTETYGVTNYENFRFNSMCGFNGAYYATDGTKIYRLDGQTDDGTAIDAEISLGASDFGSAFLKRMERAYLGLRADGQMVLKVITDEKAEDWYTLESVPSALGESHVKIGKGLKARYWRLALRNKGGSDFTLDSLRLLPLKLSRRV